MPLVIYLGQHTIAHDPALILPSEQKLTTLATLQVNDTAATSYAPDNSHLDGTLVTRDESQNERVLFLEALTEEDIGIITDWLKQEVAHHIMLVWPQPVPYIAAKLAQGEDAERTPKDWQQIASATLKLFRQHRRQVTLIGAEPGVASPQPNETTLLTLPASTHAPLYSLAATQLLTNNPRLLEITDQLVASSVCVYPHISNEQSQVTIALHEHQETVQKLHRIEQQLNAEKNAHQKAKQQIEERDKELASVKEENDLVILELHRLQELLESKLIERAGRETWIHWLRAHSARYINATYQRSRAHRKILQQQIKLLEVSQYFDKQWYLEQYPDVANSKVKPAEHYLKFGAIEGRNPSPNFDTEFYITQNPDVANAGQHPLLHFLHHGQKEQRQTKVEQLQLPSPLSGESDGNALASQEAK